MFDSFDEVGRYGSIAVLILSFFSIFLSGIFFGGTYYVLEIVETAFQNTDCVIENNIFVESCQDLWGLSIYPVLAMKEMFIWMSFFFIFAMVLGMLVLGYKSGKSPALLGLLVVFIMAFTYLGIEMANIYIELLENSIFYDMMVEFPVYNMIMLNFHWFIFIVSLASLMMALANFQRVKTNSVSEELDY